MHRNLGGFVLAMTAAGWLSGCSTATTTVSFSYQVEASRGLPEGMDTLIIMPAKVGPTTDPKWSDMSTTILQSLVNESRASGTKINVSDRRDTQVTFDEADLRAAGMSTKPGGGGGQVLAAEGAILSNINVKVTIDRGSQRTLSGLSLWGGGGRRHGYGGTDVRTEEVETVSRNMTVQTEFKLVDAGNNKVWEHYLPRTYRATERTKASPIFGSSQTEAELTPEDQIIATLVERGAREFISRLMPCRIDVELEVESSSNKDCVQGVRMLGAEEYESALTHLSTALQDNPNDHRAAFAAGIACEAMGRFENALTYYKKACTGEDNPVYRDARDRVKVYGVRAKKS